MQFAVIQTDRLCLRYFNTGDSKDLHNLWCDFSICVGEVPGLFGPQRLSLSDWIIGCRDELIIGTKYVFGCWLSDADRLIGLVSLEVAQFAGKVGFCFSKNFEANGYEVEALQRLIDLGLRALHLQYVYAEVEAPSLKAHQILEEAGFTCDEGYGSNSPAKKNVHTQVYHIKDSDKSQTNLSGSLPLVIVSSVALVDKDDRVLLGQRRIGASMAGLWEFPGGKLDPGETAAQAAIREIYEELGVVVGQNDLRPFGFVSYRYTNFHLLMSLFVCRSWSGSCRAISHQEIKWVPAKDLTQFGVPEADTILIEDLKTFLLSGPVRTIV